MSKSRTEIVASIKSRAFGCYRTSVLMAAWALVITVILAPVTARAASSATEYQVKAAYLYHFTQFVEWPPEAFETPNSNFRICVVGADPFGELLTPLAKRTHFSHPISLRYPTTAHEARNCHLLYLANPKGKHEAKILKAIQNTPLLTVSSQPGFAIHGGVIGFVMTNKRVRLEINRAAAHRANIQLSAKLLEVASVVENGNPREKRP